MKKLIKILLLILTAVITVLLAKSGWHKFLDRFFPLKYEGYIEKYSEEYGLDKYLVMGVINAESSFDHRAHSGIARGLMQLTGDTAKWIADKLDLNYYEDIEENPEMNIQMGCYYLSYLIGQYQNIDTALAAYNAGMGNVSSWLKNPDYSGDGITLDDIPYTETKKYVSRVKKLEQIYKKLY